VIAWVRINLGAGDEVGLVVILIGFLLFYVLDFRGYPGQAGDWVPSIS
jgi:hypothetical protein